MKFHKLLLIITAVFLACFAQSCEDEKDMVVITGNLPLKTSTLYIFGDATPTLWDINSPTPLAPSQADPLIFQWEGTLVAGELKACMATGSFDQPQIHPFSQYSPISRLNITDEKFQCYAVGDDLKWVVKDPGRYRLTFNLREWTFSTVYLGAI